MKWETRQREAAEKLKGHKIAVLVEEKPEKVCKKKGPMQGLKEHKNIRNRRRSRPFGPSSLPCHLIRSKCGKNGQTASNCPSEVECWACGKKGHLERDCTRHSKVKEENGTEDNRETGIKEMVKDLIHSEFGTLRK
uniref:CCHC-type domain-containing protein n=1 Tax=Callorhinchus milii TaxID=7868 RepID=A0A4W3KJK5_CALMI